VEGYQDQKQKTLNQAHTKNKKQLNILKNSSLFNRLKHRVSSHVAIIIAALLVASVGTYAAPAISSAKIKKSSNLASSANDQQTILAAGSVLAENSKSMVSGDISQKSKDINNQVVLETAGDGFLAKSQPVSTEAIPSKNVKSYKVQSGENIDAVAKKFNVTVDTIRWTNGLNEKDELRADQEIVILPINGTLYTISASDSLESIASKYHASIPLIEDYNSIVSGEPLELGRKILIPDNTSEIAVDSSAEGMGESSDTSLTNYSGGGANGYSYGYCTWYVASRRSVPSNWGNAKSWYSAAQASGFKVGSSPVAGAIAWTGAGYAGHVAYVEKVENGQVLVSEMNYNGGWGRRTSRWVSPGAFRYIY
jgi:surface antigen